jgi:hypothetical protein
MLSGIWVVVLWFNFFPFGETVISTLFTENIIHSMHWHISISKEPKAIFINKIFL